MISVLASPPAAADSLFRELLPWLVALVILVIAGAVVIAWVRRLACGDQDGLAGEGFTLYELREMRRAGQLTDEQFERARAALIEQLRGRSPDEPGSPPAESEGSDDDR